MCPDDANAGRKVDAKEAGLHYFADGGKGYSRKKKGNKTVYFDEREKIITDEAILQRIRALVIPPAWQNVWVSPYKNSHLQATGIDKKGRKQYKYHEKWNRLRNEKKFLRMREFGDVLPQVREAVEKDLRKRTLCREKVLATAVAVLDQTMIRVGNEEYAKTNESFGLTTLRDEHVKNLGDKVRLTFKGKRSVEHQLIVKDRKLASIIAKCKDIPGHELFQYYDAEGGIHPVHSEDVNDYLKEISGLDISAKSFRTWGGSCIAIKALLNFEEAEDEQVIKKNLVAAIKKVSGCLGNTPAVCKKYYIHPLILDQYSAKALIGKIRAIEKAGLGSQPRLAREEKIFQRILAQFQES